jgi:hypothetical protein
MSVGYLVIARAINLHLEPSLFNCSFFISTMAILEAPANPIKRTVERLLSSSEIVHLAVWIDGQYTPVELLGKSKWAEGRELYFKIEGRLSKGLSE